MTRQECEHRIALHFDQIIAIAKEYFPDCDYLNAAFVTHDDGVESYFVTNGTMGEAPMLIDFHRNVKNGWGDVFVQRDHVTGMYSVLVDGKIIREHLAKDELSEVMRELML